MEPGAVTSAPCESLMIDSLVSDSYKPTIGVAQLQEQSLPLSVCCCADAGPVKDDDLCTVQERSCRGP